MSWYRLPCSNDDDDWRSVNKGGKNVGEGIQDREGERIVEKIKWSCFLEFIPYHHEFSQLHTGNDGTRTKFCHSKHKIIPHIFFLKSVVLIFFSKTCYFDISCILFNINFQNKHQVLIALLKHKVHKNLSTCTCRLKWHIVTSLCIE